MDRERRNIEIAKDVVDHLTTPSVMDRLYAEYLQQRREAERNRAERLERFKTTNPARRR
jgi:hypothetical protein